MADEKIKIQSTEQCIWWFVWYIYSSCSIKLKWI